MKNLSGLMKQAQQMQAKMQEMQAKLEGMEIEGEAGAGLVSVTLNGKGDLRRIKIDPKVIDPADAEMLEDLIVAAHADAKQQDRGATRGGDAEGHRRPATAAGDEAAVLRVRRNRCAERPPPPLAGGVGGRGPRRRHLPQPPPQGDGSQLVFTTMGGPEIEKLIGLLAKLPGMGPRSARRAALKMLQQPEARMLPLAVGARRGGARGEAVPAVRQSRQPRPVLDLHRSAARPAR